MTIVGCVESKLPKCTQCGHEFEDFGRGWKVCPECKPQRGREIQFDVWQYMRSVSVGARLGAGFRLMKRGTT